MMKILVIEYIFKKIKKGSVVQNGSKWNEKKLFLFIWNIDDFNVFYRTVAYKSWTWIYKCYCDYLFYGNLLCGECL